jgi:uncharacterized protein GlcG (DUF336 family)
LLLAAGLLAGAAAQDRRPGRPEVPAPLEEGNPEPGEPDRGRPRPRAPGLGNVPPVCANGQPALAGAEAETLALAAAAALDEPRLAAAVVDRLGNPLAVYRKPGTPDADLDLAVGLARTGAFFSHDQAPLSSRTVRFISGVHFPPGVARAPSAALYGIENTNRGCELNVAFNAPATAVPPARSVVHAGGCDAFDDTACGTGPVTGKPDPSDTHGPFDSPVHRPPRVAVDSGGIPVYRGSALVGGIGVYAPDAPPDHAEFAAFATAAAAVPGLAPIPQPLPDPGVVFIDGIRLPFVRQVDRPAGSAPDAPQLGPLFLGPADGACAPETWLAGPYASADLSAADVDRIVQQSIAAAERTRAVIRLPLGSRARMAIAVSDLDGGILGLYRMPDATVFSIDVAVAKARNVVWFSQDLPPLPPGTAVTNRTISFGAQPLFPAGIDSTAPGPFFDLFVDDLARPCFHGFGPGPNRNGIVFFPGSIPLYRNDQLIGGLGISGDGVEQDDYVSYLGAAGFLPPEALWADRRTVRGVRLPFLKFPRNPEG